MTWKSSSACISAIAMLWTTSYARATIGFSSEELIRREHSTLREELSRALADHSLERKFADLGIDRDEAKLRLAGMTDNELNQLQTGIAREAGGDVVIISTTTLLIVILIILVLA